MSRLRNVILRKVRSTDRRISLDGQGLSRSVALKGVLRSGLRPSLRMTLPLACFLTAATAGAQQAPPRLGPPASLSLPPVVTRTLSNGLKVVVVEHHELPVADFNLVIGTGGEADPADHVGLADLTADLLNEGTATRSALAIADQVAYLGVVLDASSGWDGTQVTLHTTTAKMDSALALIADLVLAPSFPAQELERLRKDRLTALLQMKDEPTEIADRAYARLVFGERHPYGQPLSGTEASMQKITRGDVARFWETYYRPNNATLIAVGDITPDEVVRRAERLFGRWQRRDVPQTTFPEPPLSRTTTVYLIDKPGAPQSSVRIGAVGVPRSTEDYFALRVMNTILGEAFTSRLNANLREQKGYTYGAGSRFSMRRSAGPFTALAEVVAEKTDSSVIEFLRELRGIRDTVPSDELAKAKRYLQLRLPGQFETTTGIAAQLVPLVLYGLPLDYYNSFVQQIERITQADVQRVARRYLDPSKMAVVIVGDRKSVEPGLKAIRVGDVVLRDITGGAVVP